jgi:NTE family protein
MVLASAAIPSIFPAVQIGDDFYWDGLFSSNPPISPVLRKNYMGTHRFPDEVWIVIIDPMDCKKVPTSPDEILERRTQMTSNISLIQELEKIAIFTEVIRSDGFKDGFLENMGFGHAKDVVLRFIKISDNVQNQLDYSTKLSRSPHLIDMLVADGKKQATAFVSSLSKPGLTPQQAFAEVSK